MQRPQQQRGGAPARTRSLALALVVLGAWLTACAATPEPPSPERTGPAPAVVMWPFPPETFLELLQFGEFEIVSAEGAGAGVTGTMKWEVIFPGRPEPLPLKWKRAAKGDADGWNNAPRKELATYAIQEWFLDPEDYIVPLAVMRCVPLEIYAHARPRAKANMSGAQCVLGQLSLWIENVTVPDRLYDEDRFRADPRYARHMADLNLLTYLVEHEDGREGNFLVSLDPANRKVYSIDNGVAFGGWVHNFLVKNWNVIHVPALRRASIERLRRVNREAVDRLGVVAELHLDQDGILRSVVPGSNRDPSRGSRTWPGGVQIGLRHDEIDAVELRLVDLLARVDRGELPLF